MALNHKLEAIQRSTRTLVPFMVPFHDTLRMKYGWYYRWHLLKYSSLIHLIALIVFTAGLATGTLAYYGSRPGKTLAASDETCYWVGATANWNVGTNWANASAGVAGTCAAPSSIPDSGTAVVFDVGNTTAITLEVDVNVFSLTLTSGYTGTFDN